MKVETIAFVVVCCAIAVANGFFAPDCSRLGCKGCTWSGCTSCYSGKYLYQNTCLRSCPDGYYEYSAFGMGVCTACRDSSCKKCTGTRGSTCLECKTAYLDEKTGKCVYNCPRGTYQSRSYSGGKRCIACSVQNCAKCYSATRCSECNIGYYQFKATTRANVQCVPDCPQGYTKDFRYRRCMKCGVEGCIRCYSSSARDKCFGCETGKMVLEQTSCVTQCPDGYEAKPLAGTMYCSQIPTTTVPSTASTTA